MKTIIQRPEKSRCQVRHTMIKECLELGYKPIRVTEQKAQELCFGGRNYIHVPKSLYKNKVKKHYVHVEYAEEHGGWQLKKI